MNLKHLLTKALLVVAMLGGGTNVSWGQTTAFSQDFTSVGESTDPTDYGFTLTYGSGSSSTLVNFTVTGGVLQCVAGPYTKQSDGARTGTATATFDAISTGNEVTVSYTWALGNATGNASGSYTKTRIGNSSGNALELAFYGSYSNTGHITVNGTEIYLNSALRNTTYTVTATLNMNTQKITALTMTCSNSTYSYTASEAIDFASAITSVDRFAFENSERQNWANTSSIDNVSISYKEAKESVESIVVNYKYGETIIATENVASDGLYTGDSYTVPFRMYVSKDGALFKTTANSSNYYNEVVTLTTNTIVNKSLTAVEFGGGTLELLEDLDDSNGENADIRASYGLCYNNKSYTSAVTLTPGVYTFIVKALNKGRGSSIKVGETTVCGIDDINSSKGSWTDKTFTGIEIYTAGNVTLAKGSSAIDCYDIIIAIRTADATVSKTISSAGWATYCSPYALDFSSAITNLDAAYIVTGGANGVLNKTAVTGTVPANTGLLLKGSEGTVTIPVAASGTTDVSANIMTGVTTATKIDAEAGWVLMASPSLGFYKNTNAFTVGANTAYIPTRKLDPTTARKYFSLFADETTGIANVSENVDDDTFVDLSGRRVAQPTKGLYIVNGKKVLVK